MPLFHEEIQENTAKRVFFNLIKRTQEFSRGFTGLKITAGQRAMSGQNGGMTGHKLHSSVLLIGH